MNSLLDVGPDHFSLCTSVSLQMRDNGSCPSSRGKGRARMHLSGAGRWLQGVRPGTGQAPLLSGSWSSHAAPRGVARGGWLARMVAFPLFLPVPAFVSLGTARSPWLATNS